MTFNSSLKSIIRSSLPLVLCGDFNFPEINWEWQVAPGNENLSNTFCNMVNDAFLSQINFLPTRGNGNRQQHFGSSLYKCTRAAKWFVDI